MSESLDERTYYRDYRAKRYQPSERQPALVCLPFQSSFRASRNLSGKIIQFRLQP